MYLEYAYNGQAFISMAASFPDINNSAAAAACARMPVTVAMTSARRPDSSMKF